MWLEYEISDLLRSSNMRAVFLVSRLKSNKLRCVSPRMEERDVNGGQFLRNSG